MQWEALRLQLSMQRGLARRGRPERAMRTGDANVSNMVGAAGLEPARPKPEDFKFALPVRSTFEIRSDDLETTR